jgi:hypothetical protein
MTSRRGSTKNLKSGPRQSSGQRSNQKQYLQAEDIGLFDTFNKVNLGINLDRHTEESQDQNTERQSEFQGYSGILQEPKWVR